MMGGQLEDKTAMRATKTFSGPMRALLALTLGYVGLLPLTASAQRAGAESEQEVTHA